MNATAPNSIKKRMKISKYTGGEKMFRAFALETGGVPSILICKFTRLVRV